MMYQRLNTVAKTTVLLLIGLFACFAQAVEQKNDAIAKGEYIARLGGCASCHTLTDNKPLAGGYELHTPFGLIDAPNITPDVATGIGSWNFDDFWQAMHYGKAKEGKLLYPAFPYTSYTKMQREDVQALFAYLQSLPAIRQETREPRFSFPYNQRIALYVWRALYFNAGEYQKDKSQTDEWNRGAYLVEGIGHCGECHTTRNALGAVDQNNPLVGGLIPEQNWYAPNLSLQKGGDLEGWTQKDIIDLLKTGLSSKGSALGPMADVVRNSTQYMTDSDLKAVAVYLASLAAPTSDSRAVSTHKALDYTEGEKLYAASCANCHGDKGEGVAGIYPALANNPTVLAPNAINSIRAVLWGGFMVSSQSNPEPYSMPPFADALNDQQIAAVLNYIRQSWGNNATALSAESVRVARHQPIQP